MHGIEYPKRQSDNKSLSWDPERWYRFRIKWSPTETEVWRDEERIAKVNYPDKGVIFRHLYLNNDNHHVFKGLSQMTYRNVSIITYPHGPKQPPYPASPVISNIEWAPVDSVIRKAEGGDNWPLTWADDDAQYSSYGDGWGFEPFVSEKLSMGIVKVSGGPSDFTGVNIPAVGGEFKGHGHTGRKASGILMVDGVLYLLARNLDNAQLAWSDDYGSNWTWVDWKFTESFGCPTFLNFGKNYAGARDGFVYVYSSDSDSAYESADAMVLARVPKERIREQEAYQYYAGLDEVEEAIWSDKVADRAPVFENPGDCYRSGITFNPAIGRYLWCHFPQRSLHPRGSRFGGGIGIYDSPTPWGPWTTVFYTENWDMGPGETGSIPTKWISKDGRTIHLVSSSDDHFTVRQATLTLDPSFNPMKSDSKVNVVPFRDENSPARPFVTPRTIVKDRPIPETEGAGMTVHVEPGTNDSDFHITFWNEAITYAHYDGRSWSSPIKVAENWPFRSGAHMAIGPDNAAHLSWVQGGDDRHGTVMYCKINDGRIEEIQPVHSPQGWNECDIALNSLGEPTIVANTDVQSQMAVYEQTSSGWSKTVIPSNNGLDKWAPTIAFANDDLLLVAHRRKDRHPFVWSARDNGVWTIDNATPWRSYEPNAIPFQNGILAASMDGFVYKVQKRNGAFATSALNARETKRGIIRGQHVGIGLTDDGVLFLGHSDMSNDNPRDRKIGDESRIYYSYTPDQGLNWTYNVPVSQDAGQGHGDLAANGSDVMIVWPDIRNGNHLRFTHLQTDKNSAYSKRDS